MNEYEKKQKELWKQECQQERKRLETEQINEQEQEK